MFWDEFLRTLADRGLRGVKLIIADGHKGLKATAAKVLGATIQRCRVHFMRNALACVGKKDRPIVTAALRTAFDQDTLAESKDHWAKRKSPPCKPAQNPAREQITPRRGTLLRLQFQVQHPAPVGHRMLRWINDTSTSTARNVA